MSASVDESEAARDSEAVVDGGLRRFESMELLRQAHTALLKRANDEPSAEVVADIQDFIARACATGAVLDAYEDRWGAQTILDYWITMLYRLQYPVSEAALAEFDPMLAPELADSACPYVGLQAFQAADLTLFFGRQRLVADWLKRLETERLLAVVGASGSGKSSLVLAGVIGALQGGALPGSASWRYPPPIVPGSDPLLALARLLPPASTAALAESADQVASLRANPAYLTECLEAAGAEPVVLIVDQLEELFTLCSDPAERQAFADGLLQVVASPHARHLVLVTMRSDFAANIARVSRFQEPFERSQVNVVPLSAGEIREAIERPAQKVGLRIDDAVVDDLVREILGEPAGLPLLQFTLLKLWQHRDRNRVTRQVFERVGGPREALARSAEGAYADLIPEQQVTARRIFLRLARPGEGLEVTSNRVRRDSLYEIGEDRGRIDTVLDKLLSAGLLRLTAGQRPDEEQVEVSHEALIRNWPRLVDWLEDERGAVRRQFRLTQDARDWQRANFDEGLLYRGTRLGEALEWQRDHQALLNPLELQFLTASRDLQSREEAAMRRRARFRTVAIVATVAGLLFCMFLATILYLQQQLLHAAQAQFAEQEAAAATAQAFAEQQKSLAQAAEDARQAAEEQRDRADKLAKISVSRQLVTQALNRSSERLDVALLASAQAIHASDSDQARLTLLKMLQVSPSLVAFLPGHQGYVASVAFSPDGRVLATGGEDKLVHVWDAATHQPIGPLLRGATEAVYSICFSADGNLVIAAGDDSTIYVWDRSSGRDTPVRTFSTRDSVYSLALRPDGTSLATATLHTLILWDFNTGKQLGEQAIDSGAASGNSLAFSPDGTRLASGNTFGGVDLWDADLRERVQLDTENDLLPGGDNSSSRGAAVAFSPDGTTVAGVSHDKAIQLWDVASGSRRGPPLRGHADSVWSIAFSPDGRTLASAGRDLTIKLWAVGADQVSELRTLTGHTSDIASLDFSPDGQTLASASNDHTVRLWDVRSSQPLVRQLTGHTSFVQTVAFSPDGKFLASGGYDRVVRLWDVDGQQPAAQLPPGAATVSRVGFTRDGRTLYVGAAVDQSVTFWDLAARRLVGAFSHKPAAAERALAVSPDGTLVATVDRSTIRLQPVASNGQTPVQLNGTDDIREVVFSADGRWLASSSYDLTIRVWDVASGQQVFAPFTGHSSVAYGLSFSPDASLLAAISRDNTIRLWDLTTGTPYRGGVLWDGGLATALAFSPDGSTLAAAADDRTIHLWDVRSGLPVGTLTGGHTDTITDLAFSPDGHRLASASDDTTVGLWDVSVDSWLSRACRMANRNLTPAEWSQLLGEEAPYEATCPDLPVPS